MINQLYSMEKRLNEIRALMSCGKKLVLFGAGEKCRDLIQFLEQANIIPYCICDNDPEKWRKKYYGYNVVSIDHVKEKDCFFILSVAINNYEEIINQIGKNVVAYHMCMPFRIDKTFLHINDVMKNKEAYQKIYDHLEDEHSKKLFIKSLNYKLTGDATDLLKEIDGDTFFDKKIIAVHSSHVFVDCGAYTGDTLIRFYGFTGGGV